MSGTSPPATSIADDNITGAGSSGTSVSRLLSSYGVLVIANLACQALGFIGLAVVARRVGPHDLGAYGFASNLSGYFALPLMAGMAVVGIRELATADDSRGRIVAEVQSLQVLNGVVAYVLLIALVPVLTSDPLSRALLPLTGLALVINAAELGWAMQGMQSLRPLALYRVLGQIAYLAVLLAVLTGGATGTERYALCNALGFGVTAILTIIYVWRRLGARIVETLAMPRRLFGHFATRVRSSLASSISLTMIMIYYTMDFVLLGYLRDDYAVGEYTAASRLPLAVTALASLWVTVFYPHAARLFYADRDRLRRQVGRFATLSLLVGLPLVPLGFVMGHQIMAALFGRAYGSSGTAFAILLSSSAAALLNANIGQILLAARDDRAFLLSVTVGAVLNLVLNVALIPPLGVTGSALATLLAESIVIAMVSLRFWNTIGRIELEWHRLIRAAFALGGTVALLLLLRSVAPWWGTLLASGVGYVTLLVAVRAVMVAEIRQVLRDRT